jgi:hypothetical protein
MADLPIDAVPLGAARPAYDRAKPLRPQHAPLAEAELDLFAEAIGTVRPDRAFHLYADPILRRIVRRPRFPTRVSLLVFFARWHHPRAFGDPMSLEARAGAWFQRALLERWRRRGDAGPLFFLDAEAARRLAGGSSRGAAPACWFPEPPILEAPPPLPFAARAGAVLWGQLAPRKGIDLAARAMRLVTSERRLTLAGNVEEGYRAELERLVAEMRRDGVAVDLRDQPQGEAEGLALLARARVALLPYPRHYGMSRVLLEAASVGAPVITHHRGLLAHLVRTNGLGEAIDCFDADAFAAALTRASEAPPAGAEERLQRFARLHAEPRFADALRRGFGIEAGRSEAPDRAFAVLGSAAGAPR